MPDPYRSSRSQNTQNRARDEIEQLGRYDHFFSIESVRQYAAQKTKADEREGLEKSRQAELQRRTREIVNLIEACHVAHVHRRICAENSDPDQPVVANQERRPRTNGLVWLVRRGGVGVGCFSGRGGGAGLC